MEETQIIQVVGSVDMMNDMMYNMLHENTSYQSD